MNHPDLYRDIADLKQRMESQVRRLHSLPLPIDFSYDRNGLRLGISALEDEYIEVYDVWVGFKRNLNNPEARERFRHELLDIASVAMIMLSNIPADS